MELNVDFDPMQGHVDNMDAYQAQLSTPPLSNWVNSFWQLNVPHGRFNYHSIPDNCVDWVINLNCFEDNFVVRPFLAPIVYEISGPATYFGVRFTILGHQGLCSIPVGAWGNDDAINASDILPSFIVEAVFEHLNNTILFEERCQQVSQVFSSYMSAQVFDTRVVRFIQYCHHNSTSNINLSSEQCMEFGLSSRQLRRLSQLYLGVSPRDFARVIRFQRAIKLLRTAPDKISCYGPYYDQSHYIKEFKRLSGMTPKNFWKMSVLYNSS
ncbi:helix-turn-helix domain-containing protein [Thalassotalea ganghwensis]